MDYKVQKKCFNIQSSQVKEWGWVCPRIYKHITRTGKLRFAELFVIAYDISST